jgi:hypothetical protein
MNVRNPVGLWVRDRLMGVMMRGDWYLKFAEKEVINNCPVPLKDPREHP